MRTAIGGYKTDTDSTLIAFTDVDLVEKCHQLRSLDNLPRRPDARNLRCLGSCLKRFGRGDEAREALGRAARARVIEGLAIESVVGRYQALYEIVIAREGPETFALTTPSLPRITNLSATFDDTAVR